MAAHIEQRLDKQSHRTAENHARKKPAKTPAKNSLHNTAVEALPLGMPLHVDLRPLNHGMLDADCDTPIDVNVYFTALSIDQQAAPRLILIGEDEEEPAAAEEEVGDRHIDQEEAMEIELTEGEEHELRERHDEDVEAKTNPMQMRVRVIGQVTE
eukprot:jgi/Tetstr1/423891/TSEL_014514.t1